MNFKSKSLIGIISVGISILIILFGLYYYFVMNHNNDTKRLPSAVIPGGLSAEETPMFVSFGSDDNGYSGLKESGNEGGLEFTIELFASRKNPEGNRNPKTFDGTRAAITYFVIGKNIKENMNDSPLYIKRQWRKAYELGNEIGVHSFSHEDGFEKNFSGSEWKAEIDKCLGGLIRQYDEKETVSKINIFSGIGIPRGEIHGFRTPFLSYNNSTFVAVKVVGLYDCSIEEGSEPEQDMSNCFWPYTLDAGSPGDKVAAETWRETTPIEGHPGVWEMPAYIVSAPPDDLCVQYGIKPGLRSRLAKEFPDDVDPQTGKLSSMDWYLWYLKLSKDEFVASLKYTLDMRLKGNRAPLLFCIHSDIYSNRYDKDNAKEDWIANYVADYKERQEALREFVDYAQSKKDVRIVPFKDVLSWVKDPVSLD